MIYIEQPPAWVADGICAQTDPEVFFPEKGNPARTAKSVCIGCSVRVDCLTYALDTRQPHGVWGGKSERQRSRMLKEREAAA